MLYCTVIDFQVSKMRISEQNQKLIKMTKRRQKCVECGKRFESLEELRVHEENCYSMMYRCDQCYNWYESRKDLEDHRNRRHSKECGNTTNIEQDIEDHEWKCDLCQKQYGCIKELKEHEKEYHEWKCDQCKNRYIYKWVR